MRLGDYANIIHKKFQNKFPNGDSWNNFKNDPKIVCFNKYVGYPLHTDSFFIFIKRLNGLSEKEAAELLHEAGLTHHEIMYILSI